MSQTMTPEQAAKYRAITERAHHYNWQTRHCPTCKRNKSAGQFEAGSAVCRRCA